MQKNLFAPENLPATSEELRRRYRQRTKRAPLLRNGSIVVTLALIGVFVYRCTLTADIHLRTLLMADATTALIMAGLGALIAYAVGLRSRRAAGVVYIGIVSIYLVLIVMGREPKFGDNRTRAAERRTAATSSANRPPSGSSTKPAATNEAMLQEMGQAAGGLRLAGHLAGGTEGAKMKAMGALVEEMQRRIIEFQQAIGPQREGPLNYVSLESPAKIAKLIHDGKTLSSKFQAAIEIIEDPDSFLARELRGTEVTQEELLEMARTIRNDPRNQVSVRFCKALTNLVDTSVEELEILEARWGKWTMSTDGRRAVRFDESVPRVIVRKFEELKAREVTQAREFLDLQQQFLAAR